MKRILRFPTSKYEFQFEKAMFETNWIIFSILTIFFLCFSVKHLIFKDPNLVTFIGAFTMTLASLLIMKYSERYVVPVIFGVIFGTFFIQYSMFFVPDHSGIADLLWIILIALFAFYSLGTKWGVLTLFINIAGVVWQYVIIPTSPDSSNASSISVTNTLFNIIIATIAISFLLHRIIKASINANREFQKANVQLKSVADEKTILLQEVHHRVKNNLQVVSSLIRLQSLETDDLSAKNMFDATVNRVVAMALIHEKMYQKDNLSKINLEEYFQSLASDIIASMSIEKEVSFNIISKLERLGNRTIVPLALIFNELISNSLKYAFENKNSGEIKLIIEMLNDDSFTLLYKDSGDWKPDSRTNTFGMTLIETFTEQLDGTIQRNGTEYLFHLKNID